jgi:hypothetical protein
VPLLKTDKYYYHSTSSSEKANPLLLFRNEIFRFTLFILKSILECTSVSVASEQPMHIITGKHLNRAAEQCPDAAKEKGARWQNFVEVRQVFKDADAVKGYVIFNVRTATAW